MARPWQPGSYTQLVHWTQPRAGMHQTYLGPVGGWPSEARAEHSIMGGAQPAGHGSGYDGSREESGVHVSNGGGGEHHPDHAQRQQQLLQHQQRQQHQQQHPYHPQQHQQQQYNHGGAGDQELRTQYRLNVPQSDAASPPVSPTHPSIEIPTPPLPTIQKDSVTEVTQHTQTEAVRTRDASEDGSSANSGDLPGAELANQRKDKDSTVTSGGLTEEMRRQKLLEMVQSEPDTHLHHHHRQQRPRPTTFQTAFSTASPMSPSARRAPFRPASPRRRRKHRKRISKAAMRAMIM